ncbi:oxidoreductase [Anaerocolumna sp. MB42-C2]|uniref:oxidoreductase n=1 Tax=Anaerocolumna sp. MB42-C2 TaxID=3070997 RepID=UPI0027E04786|nr:FAD-dependent oxidoreductase [Anaerocolumna sp. MB42-C2]WMJ86844.1 FAD-dependent oxidoreductase [Anaerocolumna sp. MB42-C2]
MNFEKTFSPMYIGKMMVKNRLVMPPMGSCLYEELGKISDATINYYAARARGGFGLIFVEVAAVERDGLAIPEEIDISVDEAIPGLRKLASAIKHYGSRACIQLHHAGRQTNSQLSHGMQVISSSPIPCPIFRNTPKEMTTEEVYVMIDKFIAAAVRAKKAGFDMVEVHCAHGYLAAEFLSGRYNKRIDEFGGDIYSRTLFVKLIVEGIKRECGADFPVSVRMSSNEYLRGGYKENEAVVIATLLESYGVDALHLSAGTYGAYEYILPTASQPPAWNIEAAKLFKQALNIPVITVGRYNQPHVIEYALQRGDADFIALGRQSVADPEFPNKMFSNELMEIHPCISCGQRCLSNHAGPATGVADWAGGDYGMSCLQNPLSNDMPQNRIIETKDPQNVMIVGAGPAGLEAAWIAAARGHKVSLFEKNPRNRAGGQYLIASYPPNKQDITRVIKHYLYMCEKYSVDMHFDTEVNIDLIQQIKPDVLIIATGGTPLIPRIPGIEGKNVKIATDVLLGKQNVDGKILVLGGGLVGLESAMYCADYCENITVVEMMPKLIPTLPNATRVSLLKEIKKEEIEILTNTKVLELFENSALVEKDGEQIELKGFDHIVVALGVRSNKCLGDDVSGLAPVVEVIGDASKTRTAVEAIYEGAKVALRI